MSCALNSDCELSLMFSTGTCNASGKNLRSFGKVLSQSESVLIVNILDFVSAESTNLFSLLGSERLLSVGSYFSIQSIYLLLQLL